MIKLFLRVEQSEWNQLRSFKSCTTSISFSLLHCTCDVTLILSVTPNLSYLLADWPLTDVMNLQLTTLNHPMKSVFTLRI